MSNVNDGGPAFPIQGQRFELGDSSMTPTEPGMTLRDYFAAKAMAAMIGSTAQPCMAGIDAGLADCLAKGAYAIADAMLKARQS